MEGVTEFTDDDKAYMRWLNANPNGFVVNTRRAKPASYMVLHRASCRTIRTYTKMARSPGAFTERDYIKICGVDPLRLERWVKQHGGKTFSNKCSKCELSQ